MLSPTPCFPVDSIARGVSGARTGMIWLVKSRFPLINVALERSVGSVPQTQLCCTDLHSP
jgi:hypothetical protein